MDTTETKPQFGPYTVRVADHGDGRYGEPGDCAIVDDKGCIVAETFRRVGEDDYRDAKALAELLAAAPDLLEVCEIIYRVAKDCSLPGPVHLSLTERDMLQWAIAKAKGGQ